MRIYLWDKAMREGDMSISTISGNEFATSFSYKESIMGSIDSKRTEPTDSTNIISRIASSIHYVKQFIRRSTHYN